MRVFSSNGRNLLLAVILGPLAIIPAMIIGITLLIILFPSEADNLRATYTAGLVIALVGLAYSYGFTLFYGMPIYLILRKLEVANLATVTLSALLPAAIIGVATSAVEIGLLSSYFSLVVAYSCWWLSSRNDRESSNK